MTRLNNYQRALDARDEAVAAWRDRPTPSTLALVQSTQGLVDDHHDSYWADCSDEDFHE